MVEMRKADVFEDTMAHMTYLQVEEAVRDGAVVLFPVGVIEEHGPHLPLSVDVYGASLQARMIKSELEKREVKAVIAPPFYWGINHATGSFSGSFTCREETMVSVLWDGMASLKRWGFKQVFFVNHHLDGGHVRALDKAIRKARQDLGIRAFLVIDAFFGKRLGFRRDDPHVLFYQSLAPAAMSSPYLDIHAEAYETSFMWHYLPELVNLEILKGLKPTNLTSKDLEAWLKGWDDARRITPEGYFGDPAKADPERGRKEMEAFGRIAAELIETFIQGRYVPPEKG